MITPWIMGALAGCLVGAVIGGAIVLTICCGRQLMREPDWVRDFR